MDLTWEEAEELVNDKAEWRQRVAQCSHLDAEWSKVCFCYDAPKYCISSGMVVYH